MQYEENLIGKFTDFIMNSVYLCLTFNSSKPPSQDGFKNHSNNSKEKSGLQRGGQQGHPGRRLGLPENMDELVNSGVIVRG